MKRVVLCLGFSLFLMQGVKGATFTSNGGSTDFNSAAAWSVVGADSDGIPDSDDDVIINHPLTQSNTGVANNFTLNAGGSFASGGKQTAVFGNIILNGTVSGNPYLFIYSTSGTIATSGTLAGNISFTLMPSSHYTINAGSNFNNIVSLSISASATLANSGTMRVSGTFNNSGTFTNNATGVLSPYVNLSGTGIYDFTAAGNTVSYLTVGYNTVLGGTYHHLNIGHGTGGAFKYLGGNITVNGNINVTGGVYLDCANFNIICNGNYINSGGQIPRNTNTISFIGSTDQTFATRAFSETFNNVIVNKPSGTLTLGDGATANGTIRAAVSMQLLAGTLDLGSVAKTIQIGGSFTNNGVGVIPQSNTVLFNGTAAQTISGSGTTDLFNLTINNSAGATVTKTGGTFNLSGTLTLTKGTLANSSGTFTFKSDLFATSMIATVPSGGGNISGSYICERFIPTMAADWRDLASPVVSTTVLDWDNEIYMSGVGGADGNATSGSGIFYSVTTYTQSTAWFDSIVSTSHTLVNGRGYEVYVGDNLSFWSGKSITTIGTPRTGRSAPVSIPVTNTPTSSDPGWTLVGNPYLAPIRFDLCNKTNLDATILIYDNTGTYNSYPGSTTIPHHQGFWVHCSSGTPTMSIPESAKVNSTATSFFAAPDEYPGYDVKLTLTSDANPWSHSLKFQYREEATNGYDAESDAYFLKSPKKDAPAITLAVEGKKELIQNAFPTEGGKTVTFPIRTKAGANGKFTVTADVFTSGTYAHIYLTDLKENKKVDLKEEAYSFDLKTTDDPNRFTVTFTNEEEVISNTPVGVAELPKFFGENHVKVINTTENVYVQFDLDKVSTVNVSVTNVLGQQVNNATFVAHNELHKLNVNIHESGVYFVNVSVNGENTISKKVFLNPNNE